MSKLLEQFRLTIVAKHYSRRTRKAYERWIRQFILYHGKRHPKEMGGQEVEAFLSYLASERRVAASTQNQALSALLFLYKDVLDMELPWLDGIVRAKRPQKVPVVLSVREVEMLLDRLHGPPWLVASILYGSGMRLMEARPACSSPPPVTFCDTPSRPICSWPGTTSGPSRSCSATATSRRP